MGPGEPQRRDDDQGGRVRRRPDRHLRRRDPEPPALAGHHHEVADRHELRGHPQRFVSDPKILQQGFATAEPYIYKNEISQWGKDVGYQLLSELGYNIYPEPLAVRKADVTDKADCLKKLVPIMQQSQIDFLNAPSTATP